MSGSRLLALKRHIDGAFKRDGEG